MDILAVILSGLSLVVATVILIITLKKGNASSGGGITQSDIDKINESEAKELEKLSKFIASNISSTNEQFVKVFDVKLEEYTKSTKERLDNIDATIAKALAELRRESNERLESIQKSVGERLTAIQTTVDEKLQKSIDERLKTSFESVIAQIGNVNKAIGEIRSIADDVGSLKSILSNVKTKGIAGEVILGSIIGEILSPDQYEENVATNSSSPRDVVEFAIKIPSGDDYIYLPIDSKFPLESYNKLKDAVSAGDKSLADSARGDLARQIKNEAKTIQKYIDVPNTTDFAIMFLPTESLYIEAIEMGLFEICQREYRVNIAGPTTLSAIINALRLGFNSLEIQKRSGEVFKLLGAIKTEFNKFADALASTQQRIDKAGQELESLVGTRTRAMQRKLKEIGEVTDAEAKEIIGNDTI